MPARAAVAVLIRSPSTLMGVTHHSPVDQSPREDVESPGRGGCTSAPRRVRDRAGHRGSSLRRLVTSRPMPQRSRLRPTRRCRTHPGQLGTNPRPSPAQRRRRPPPQQRVTHRGRHQDQSPSTNPGLQTETTGRRQDRPRNQTLHQALHRSPSLATTRTPTRRNNRLTNIEASVTVQPSLCRLDQGSCDVDSVVVWELLTACGKIRCDGGFAIRC